MLIASGKRRKSAQEDAIPCIIASDRAPSACRKSWAPLIRNICEIDPLVCPKCRGTMRIIRLIEHWKLAGGFKYYPLQADCMK